MIFCRIPFHTNTLTFLLLRNRRLNFSNGSLLGAWLRDYIPNSIIISVINILRTTRSQFHFLYFLYNNTFLNVQLTPHLLQQRNLLTSVHSLTKLAENAQSPIHVEHRNITFKSVLKSIFSIISAAGLRKKKQTRQYSSRENYYKVTSGRGTELKLWSIGGEFNWQTNKIPVFHGVKQIPS